MGGCATKPKVLKGEDDIAPEQAPAPAPAPEPEPETAPKEEGSEGKEVVNLEEAKETTNTHEEGDMIQEGSGSEEKVEEDEGNNKPRSLSNLFKESEQEKESSGNGDKTIQTVTLPSEPEKYEGNPNTEASTTTTTTTTTTPPTAEFESSRVVATAFEEKPVTTVADLQKGKTEESEPEKESSRIDETTQTESLPLESVKHEENPKIKTTTTALTADDEVEYSTPPAVELESTRDVDVDVAAAVATSEEKPVTTVGEVQTGNTENDQKEKRKEVESVAAAKDIGVIEKATKDDKIQ